MSSLIQSLKRSGALLILHDYRLGHTRDLSGNARHGVGTDLRWERRGVTFPLGTSQILVTTDATLNALTSSTWFVWAESGNHLFTSTGKALFSKGSANASCQYIVRSYSSAGDSRIRLSSYASNRDIIGNSRVNRPPAFYGFTLDSAAAGVTYVDGIARATLAGTISFTTNTDNLTIGALGGPANQVDLKYLAFACVNRVMTSLEHAQFYAEMART